MDPTKVAEYEAEYYDFLNGMADTIQSEVKYLPGRQINLPYVLQKGLYLL